MSSGGSLIISPDAPPLVHSRLAGYVERQYGHRLLLRRGDRAGHGVCGQSDRLSAQPVDGSSAHAC